MQTIVSRAVPAIAMAPVSVGSIAGGDAGSLNIIPTDVALTGTARSYTAATQDLIERRLQEIAEAQALAFGRRGDVVYHRLCPPLVARSDETARSAAAATALVGAGRVDTTAALPTRSEDFSFMLEAKPGAFILIGNGVDEDGSFAALHTPGYDFNDEILALGAATGWGWCSGSWRSRGGEGGGAGSPA